jgi:hypothetical protein
MIKKKKSTLRTKTNLDDDKSNEKTDDEKDENKQPKQNDHVKFTSTSLSNSNSNSQCNDTVSLSPQSLLEPKLNKLKRGENAQSSPNLIFNENNKVALKRPSKPSKSKKFSSKDTGINDQTSNSNIKKKKCVMLKSSENIEHKLPSSCGESSSEDETSTTNEQTNLSTRQLQLKSKSNLKKCIIDYSYVVLVASFFAYMLASILSSCFGVFFESMGNDLGWSKYRVNLNKQRKKKQKKNIN